jgi:hypothetical protein
VERWAGPIGLAFLGGAALLVLLAVLKAWRRRA